MSATPYEYRGISVNFVESEDDGWIDEGEEWCACGSTLEDAKAAFREAVDDTLDHGPSPLDPPPWA